MNKLYTKLFFACIVLFYTASDAVFAQPQGCNTSIFITHDTIACGESILLSQTGVGGASSDDFTGGTLSGLWSSVTSGWTFGGPCGTNPLGAQHLWFAQGSTNPRQATTVGVDASCGGNICFNFKMETQSAPPCDGPDLPGEGVYFQYSTNGGATWVTIHYFNPQTYNFAGWNNYCYPIPGAAQTSSTQFRWSQVQISSPTYDLWGIDNININTCSGYTSFWYDTPISTNPYPSSFPPAISTNDTVTVSPQVTTTYTIIYTDTISDTCSANITINVEMPTIVATQTPGLCTGSTQLDALASIPANCNYSIELWDGAGDGWNAGGSPAQYHNMDVHINGSLYQNFTMLNGTGPDVHQIPVTDGDLLETFLQNWGTNYPDCGYVIKDSQGTIVRLDGLPPVAGNPPVGCNTLANSLAEVNVTCPTTLFYNYSWQTTAGTVTGLSNPNIYNPTVTVSSSTDYVVTGYDPIHPWCTALDTVTVLPNSTNITATLSGPSSICTGDSVELSFLPMVGIANWVLTLNINGSPSIYTLDGVGNNIVTGQPLTFYPSSTTTYDVVSLLDGTGCPAAVTNPSLTVTVNQLPNAGINGMHVVCETFGIFDLYNHLNGSPNLGGIWTNSAGTILSSSFYNPATSTTDIFTYTIIGAGTCPNAFATVNIINNTLPDAGQNASHSVCENDAAFNMYNFLGGTPISGGNWTNSSGNSINSMFDPSAMNSGVFTYTVPGLSPCPSNSANLTIIINQIPNAGTNGTHVVCENDAAFNLFNYLIGSPDVGGIWTDINNIPVSNMFDASTSGSGTFVFTYTVVGANPCPSATATVTVTVNPQPVVTISGTTGITQGMSTPIDFTLTSGTAPFTVIYNDGSGSITSPSFNSNTGTINVSPNSTTNYSLVSVTDANGCTSSAIGAITITVNQIPTIILSGATTICEGQNSDLDFNLSGMPNFTVEYYAIDVTNPGGILYSQVFTSTGSNLLNVSPTITTTYTLVSITDGNGTIDSTISGSITIIVNPLPIAVISGNNAICNGDQSPLNFALTGTADYNLIYNPGGIAVTLNSSGNDATTGNPIMVSPNVTTAYSIVSVTDANNCTNIGSGSANITVNPLPTISIGGTTPICLGQSSDLSFTLTGTAPYDLNYLDGGNSANITLDATGTVGGIPLSVTPNNTTTYTLVNITDANNCTATVNGSVTIVVNPLPTVTMNGSTSICIGQSTPLDFIFSGTAPYTINYSINTTNTSAVLNNNVDSIIVSPSSITTYTLLDLTDANCSNSANGIVIISVNPLPTATISGGGVICADGSTSQIDITASGTSPFNIIYSDGFNNIALNGLSIPYNFQTSTAGNYTLNSISDVTGCYGTVTGTASVVVNPLPVASFSYMPQPIDINNPIVYFTDLSSGHVAGMYDFGDGTNAPGVLGGELAHTYLDTGSYQVLYTATSTHGCTATVGHTIVIDPAFLIYIPTAFTPNTDGKNDVFIPLMMGVDEYHFYIYDRFGGLVFETEDQLEGWNGKVNGNNFALAGHYAYTVKITDMLGKKRSFTGTLTLFR